jgi:hypothetical protein
MKSLKKLNELLTKANVPEGVDPAKYERCVQDVKEKEGEDAVNPWAVCAASLQKETTHSSGKVTHGDYQMDAPTQKSTALERLQSLKKADKPSTEESPDTAPEDHSMGPAVQRLKQMGETFQNAPRQEDRSLIDSVKRHPMDRMQNIMGDMKEAAAFTKGDNYHKMKKKDYSGYMSAQQAVERIESDKHEVQDIMPNVSPEDRDEVLRVLRQRGHK